MDNTTRDTLWEQIRSEAAEGAWREPMLSSFLHGTILNHKSFEAALSFHLASKLESATLPALSLRDLMQDAFAASSQLGDYAREDLLAVHERDPACRKYSQPLLYFKGYLSIQAQRIAHYYWHQDRLHLALFMQSRISDVMGVDIHPAAKLGKGMFIDHATGIVIGETAVVEENVSMLHGVTLGGTGKERGDRHPKIRRGVLISTGAKILGNIEVGEGAKVAAGAVVLDDVPPHTTVAGMPARPVGAAATDQPALDMDHRFRRACPDLFPNKDGEEQANTPPKQDI